MSKELEALKRLGALEIGISNNGHLIKHVHDTLEYNTLLQALTPPTAEEVCKALSEYLGLTVIVGNKTKNILSTAGDVSSQHEGNVGILFYLPPHLITMIGRFYEGVIENEKKS